MFWTWSWAFLRLDVELPLRRGRSDDINCEVIVSDIWGVSVRVERESLQASWFSIDLGRSLASVCGWIYSVNVA